MPNNFGLLSGTIRSSSQWPELDSGIVRSPPLGSANRRSPFVGASSERPNATRTRRLGPKRLASRATGVPCEHGGETVVGLPDRRHAAPAARQREHVGVVSSALLLIESFPVRWRRGPRGLRCALQHTAATSSAAAPPTTPASARPRARIQQDPASTCPRRPDQRVRTRSLKPQVTPRGRVLEPHTPTSCASRCLPAK